MTLPTVQPVDWQDWLQLPAYTTQFFNTVAVPAPANIVFEIQTGYFQHALVVLVGDGDGSSWTVNLQQWSANPLEGGSLMWENFTTRIWAGTVVIPMTVAGTFLRIVDVESDIYPHNVIGYVSLFSARGFLTGYPGGTTVLSALNGVDGGADMVYNDNYCCPGEHSATLTTTATDWALNLRTYTSSGNFFDTLLADETTVPLYAIRWLAPATYWELVFTNNDVTSCDISIVVARQP